MFMTQVEPTMAPIEPTMLPIEWLSHMATIVMAIVAIVAALYAAFQYSFGKKNARISRACELADYFANNIIWRIVLIPHIVPNSHVKKIKWKDNLLFNKSEALRFIDEFKLLEDGKKPESLLAFNANFVLNARLYSPKLSAVVVLPSLTVPEFKDESARKEWNKKVSEDINGVAMNQINAFVMGLLNDLEWFCMNINSRVADGTVIYQSLHSTFLSTIQTMYFFISFINVNGPADKYYTNIMKLYNKWCKDAKKRADVHQRRIDKVEKNGTVFGSKT